ncbi:cytochrome c oxidase subunit 2 [Candidatus Phycosocius bacilliformis]|jgi:cytochrome c oxidase subunit 2|uniref:Cytochrome c oxidase subunit 2 n=1 Tax=Candidatus Phycosocius bacilliformis TaxID=1445552 RepID=A0A2P2E5N4_9PROT|nr:cytochrome c oxidase subunit II [Candidatus Phycosocius bacilliformis]GBF56368.1 cytochrome c oxidase subunit 2 [Candidatus Phycosocius bacilliformis]
MRRWQSTGLAGLIVAASTANLAWADQPHDKGLSLQAPVTEVARDITFFHDYVLLPIIVLISLFVAGLLAYCIIRFNKRANPEPAKFTHNTTIEIVWTIIPVLILAGISAYSFPLLYKEDQTPAKYDMTLKVTGHQWYWSYEYVDAEGVGFDSNMLPEADAKAAGKPYLLGTDNAVVVPVGKVVRVQVTASDVIHSWAMPSFGVKMDAVPGRLNEAWFRVDKPGLYYGQCSEICGVKHAYMPVEIKAVPQAEFDAWIASQKSADAGSTNPAAVQFAATQPASTATAQAN